MRKTFLRAGRVLSKVKAQRFDLIITVKAAHIPLPLLCDPATRVFVEVERGKHRACGRSIAANSNVWAHEMTPLEIPVTLYKDSKGTFRSKLFILRLKLENNPKNLLATFSADAASFASLSGAPSAPVRLESLRGGNRGVGLTITVAAAFVKEMTAEDETSTQFTGEADDSKEIDEQDLAGFEEDIYEANGYHQNGADANPAAFLSSLSSPRAPREETRRFVETPPVALPEDLDPKVRSSSSRGPPMKVVSSSRAKARKKKVTSPSPSPSRWLHPFTRVTASEKKRQDQTDEQNESYASMDYDTDNDLTTSQSSTRGWLGESKKKSREEAELALLRADLLEARRQVDVARDETDAAKKALAREAEARTAAEKVNVAKLRAAEKITVKGGSVRFFNLFFITNFAPLL